MPRPPPTLRTVILNVVGRQGAFEIKYIQHGRALEGSDPHELAGGFEVLCQMKGTHIGVSEMTLFKSYEIGLLRIRPHCVFEL